jgi:hypothetical protein
MASLVTGTDIDAGSSTVLLPSLLEGNIVSQHYYGPTVSITNVDSRDVVTAFGKPYREILKDRDRTTYVSWTSIHHGVSHSIGGTIHWPEDFNPAEFDRIFICWEVNDLSGGSVHRAYDMTYSLRDIYGGLLVENKSSGRLDTVQATEVLNMLPNEYYAGGNDNGEQDFFGRSDFLMIGQVPRNLMEVPKDIASKLNKRELEEVTKIFNLSVKSN